MNTYIRPKPTDTVTVTDTDTKLTLLYLSLTFSDYSPKKHKVLHFFLDIVISKFISFGLYYFSYSS